MEQEQKKRVITPYIFKATLDDELETVIEQFDDEGKEHSVLEFKDKKVKELKLISLLTNAHNYIVKFKDETEKPIKFWRRKISMNGQGVLENNCEMIGIKKNVNGIEVSFMVKVPSNFYEPIEIYCTSEDDIDV